MELSKARYVFKSFDRRDFSLTHADCADQGAITIQPDIRPDTGYPANLVSGATLFIMSNGPKLFVHTVENCDESTI